MAECITPLVIRPKESDRTIPVPCGRCEACYKRKVSAWSFRLMQQSKVSESAYFITLTYDNQHVPISPKGFATLDSTKYILKECKRGTHKGRNRKVQYSSHMQLFLKQIRKQHTSRILYYYAGEYGTKSKRPHYHAIIYNLNLELIFDKKTCNLLRNTMYDGKTEVTTKYWPHGHVTVGQLTAASVGYTLKYLSKVCKIGKADWDDRVPAYAKMSKNLGLNYLTPQMIQWHRNDLYNRMYCNVDGKKISIPRYYKLKLYQWYEINMINEYLNIQKEVKNETGYREPVTERDFSEAVKQSFRKLQFEHTQNKTL